MSMTATIEQPTPAALCDVLEAAGWRVEQDKFTGPRGAVNDGVKAALREQKAEVLRVWRERELEPRYQRVPRELALRDRVVGPRDLPGDTAAALIKRTTLFEYCLRQGPTVTRWLETRTGQYWDAFAAGDVDAMIQCEFTACLDLVAWQQRCTWAEALENIHGYELAARAFAKTAKGAACN
jgi:hypothetical protein